MQMVHKECNILNLKSVLKINEKCKREEKQKDDAFEKNKMKTKWNQNEYILIMRLISYSKIKLNNRLRSKKLRKTTGKVITTNCFSDENNSESDNDKSKYFLLVK
jgi:hypothetical protein